MGYSVRIFSQSTDMVFLGKLGSKVLSRFAETKWGSIKKALGACRITWVCACVKVLLNKCQDKMPIGETNWGPVKIKWRWVNLFGMQVTRLIGVQSKCFLIGRQFRLKKHVFTLTTKKMTQNGWTRPFLKARRITEVASFTKNDIAERPCFWRDHGSTNEGPCAKIQYFYLWKKFEGVYAST